MNRKNGIDQIKGKKKWDILVIGGGATGLGIALEACTRGYQTLLVEQSDFAKSTSSKSTKLVHGGVRYLAQGNLKLVREAAVERGLLHKNAPDLVKNLEFIIPVYNWFDRIKYTIGLKLYDWVSGTLSLGPSIFINKKKVIQYLPTINHKNLVGGVLYHDGQFDDARLAIILAKKIYDEGGYAVNYMKVKSLRKCGDNITGAELLDMDDNSEYSVQAKVVVNATGVFSDDLLQMDRPEGHKMIAVSQGVHIVLDKKFLPGNQALMIPKTSDGRVLFVLPWNGKLLAGTTDTPVNKISLEPVPQEPEIDFILETVGAYLTEKPRREDVLSVFAGLRPLAAGEAGNQKTKEISRSHKIIISPSKMFTMLGGKWTTYRKMGEDMVDKIETEFKWPATASITSKLSLTDNKNVADKELPRSPTRESDASNDLHLEVKLSERYSLFESDITKAVKEEMAMTTDDVLSRRSRLLLIDAAEALHIAREVSGIIAKLRGKEDSWINKDVALFSELAENYLVTHVRQTDS